jgi:hypothetical protein
MQSNGKVAESKVRPFAGSPATAQAGMAAIRLLAGNAKFDFLEKSVIDPRMFVLAANRSTWASF